jgi:hypothetical protein
MMRSLLLLVALTTAQNVEADEAACSAKCTVAGHCCVGAGSSCQKPSCAMGCIAGAVAKTEAACNASCVAAAPKTSICSWKLNDNITFNMCGDCITEPAPSWWPKSVVPPHGTPPGYWPPGYSLHQCGSCETLDVGGGPHTNGGTVDQGGECKLGCLFTFRPSLKPTPPPVPQPPPARAEPPICGPFPSIRGAGPGGTPNPWSGCTVGATLNFSNVFSNDMVLQMQPAKAAIYGYVGNGSSAGAKVTVTLTPAGEPNAAVSVAATVDVATGQWKAFLKPTAAGGEYTVTAKCESGCATGSIEPLTGITFGDVWYCFGRECSNIMVLWIHARCPYTSGSIPCLLRD